MTDNTAKRERPRDYKHYSTARPVMRSTTDLVRELSLCHMAIVSRTAQQGRPASTAELNWIHDAAKWIYQNPAKAAIYEHEKAQALINNFRSRFL